MDHLEEIRSKLPIEDLVGSYIQLKKAGRNLKGLCPFHNDSHPSFTVSPEKGICWCFVCNTGGDIFKFIQLIENVDFKEAVKILAQRTNVQLPAFRPEAQNERARVIEGNRAATKFFARELEKSAKHFNYFLNRGLSRETIEKFKLGFAPDSYNALKDHLLGAGFTEKELLLSGLINQRSIADKSTYDRFRNRLIFPIYDHQDSPIGFGGRIVDEGEPKYLNSPDTPAYNKSLVLYGLNWAKEAVKKEDLAIFVEGYMDVIACHQAGTENAIATSGTAFTPGQLKLIKRYTGNIAFAFDQDSAGMEATKRALELVQNSDFNVKVIIVPEGKDPDECIKESPEKWKAAVKGAVPVMDFYFAYAGRHFDVSNLEGRKGMLQFLLPLIKQYPLEMEQSEYLERLALLLKTDVKVLWRDLKKNTSKSQAKPAAPEAQKAQSFSREEFLLGFIFEYPQFYHLVRENLIDTIALEPLTEKFYIACKTVYNSASAIELGQVLTQLTPEEGERINLYRLLIEEQYPDFSEEATEREVANLIASINRQNLLKVQKEFELRIRSANGADEKTRLLNQYNEILKLKTKIN